MFGVLFGALDRKVGGALLVTLVASGGLLVAGGSALAQSAAGSAGVSATAGPAIPNGPATIHLLITGGPDAGTYDLAQEPLCSRDDAVVGDWTAGISDVAGTPSLIVATFDPSVPQGASLTVGFGSDTDGIAYVADADTAFKVDDGGDTATITVSGTARLLTAEGETPAVGTLSAVISCSSVAIGGAAAQPSAAPPTANAAATQSAAPGVSGAPGSGRNHFHVELSGGPQAGSWDIASDEPCLAGADSPERLARLVQRQQPGAGQRHAGALPRPARADRAQCRVRHAQGPLSYANPIDGPAAVVSIDDRGDSATLNVTAPVSAYDTEGTISDAGQATISVECGFILRNPLGASPRP